MRVELDRVDIEAAVEAADRLQEMRNNGLIFQTTSYETAIARGDMGDLNDFERRYLGSLCEIAVSKALRLPWGESDIARCDVGDDIEVRRVTRPSYGPLIRPKDYQNPQIHVHVAVFLESDVEAHILGWCFTETAWLRGHACAEARQGRCCKTWADTNNVRIGQRHLRPMENYQKERYL